MNEVRQQKMGSILAKDCNFSDIARVFSLKNHTSFTACHENFKPVNSCSFYIINCQFCRSKNFVHKSVWSAIQNVRPGGK